MRPFNVVLAHHDAVATERLAASLRKQFRNLAVVNSSDEVISAVSHLHAPLAVLDLEVIGMAKLKQLCSQFPSTAIVCVHRLADDRMWSEALANGAVDCCLADDVPSILLAADRYVVLRRHAAAAA